MAPRFDKGNSAAAKRDWRWSDDEIKAWQTQARAVVETLGLDTVAQLTGDQPSYIKLMVGVYDELRQPSQPFVVRFENAVFLHHIRTVVMPFLREREQQQAGQTWTRERARIKKQRQKKGV